MKTVLSIAGTDPTGGAGIQTDLKTFEAFGVYGMAVITVVCAQNTTGVFGMQPVSAELVGKQIDCVFDDICPDAVKVGMLYDAEIIHTVAERLKAYHAKNIVLDPVMMSSSGTALLHHDAAKVLQEEIAACIIPKNGAVIDEEKVRSYVKSRLSDYKVPKYVLTFQNFPINASGKVFSRELRVQAGEMINLKH